MIQILAVQVAAPGSHENQITAVRWYNPDDGQISIATTAVMVEFIAQKNGTAYAYNGRHRADVIVAPGPSPYLTTQPGKFSIDNVSLLSLPRF
jgi:hypothetical protein